MKKRIIVDMFIVLIVLLAIKIVGFVNSIPDFSIRNDIYDDDAKIAEINVNSAFTNNDLGINMSRSGYEGITKLFQIHSDTSTATLTFEYEAIVTKGSFKCVLVTPNNEVITIGEQSDSVIKTLKLDKGFSYLKVVAKDSADVNYDIRLTGIDYPIVSAKYEIGI